MPGTGKDEDTAERLLLDWVNRARDLCRESGHLAACDSQIGRTLAREPELAGSSWPGGAVKNLLEEVESTDLQDGFVAETWNKRGVFSKSLKEGGAQEWALAAKYEGYAKDCELDWPVTARMLRRVAKDYQELAKGEDERARARTWL